MHKLFVAKWFALARSIADWFRSAPRSGADIRGSCSSAVAGRGSRYAAGRGLPQGDVRGGSPIGEDALPTAG